MSKTKTNSKPAKQLFTNPIQQLRPFHPRTRKDGTISFPSRTTPSPNNEPPPNENSRILFPPRKRKHPEYG